MKVVCIKDWINAFKTIHFEVGKSYDVLEQTENNPDYYYYIKVIFSKDKSTISFIKGGTERNFYEYFKPIQQARDQKLKSIGI